MSTALRHAPDYERWLIEAMRHGDNDSFWKQPGHSVVDNVELGLAIAEPSLSARYASLAGNDPDVQRIAATIDEEHQRTVEELTRLTGHERFRAAVVRDERVAIALEPPCHRRAAHQHIDGIVHDAEDLDSIDGFQLNHGHLLPDFMAKRLFHHPVDDLFHGFRFFAEKAMLAEGIARARLRRRSAEHCEVLRKNKNVTTIDQTMARDHTVARIKLLVESKISRTMHDKLVKLFKRTFIK